MSHSPSLPDRPTLNLDPDMSVDEQLAALRDHYIDVSRVHDELTAQLETARNHQSELREEVTDLQKENEALKTSSLYLATVEELIDDQVLLKQHGNNQEVLTDVSPRLYDRLDAGDRVAINDSFAIQTVLDTETDARAQAMEISEKPDVGYEDIGGLETQIQEVREAVEDPLTNPEKFREVGIDPPTGVLLYGPPGTGKTMLAKAVANRTDATFIKMAGSELVQKFIGEGARLVRDLFEMAAEREPAIIFIDEIDAIASKRTESKTSGDAEVQRTMMQLLAEMDGFEDRGQISIIAATNRFDMLDRAILRPGRFDRLIEVPKPDFDGRKIIFEIHTRKMNIADDVDFVELAELADSASGADIKAICTEAGMYAIRDDRLEVKTEDFEQAWRKIKQTDDTEAEVSKTFA